MAENAPIIETKGLNVFYGATCVISGVDMDVDTNRITAIIGPSGSARALCCGASTG